MTSARAGGRAPRAMAIRPAITPAPPSAIAAHSTTVTKMAVRCSACHHGGPAAGWRRDGTATLGPAAQMTIMASADTIMAAAASQPVSRAHCGRAGRSRLGLTGPLNLLHRRITVCWSPSWLT